MKKIILLIGAALLATATFVAIPASPLDAAPQEPAKIAHTDGEVWNVCHWFDAVYWGLEPNEATKIRWRSVHYYGLHYAECCYAISGYPGFYSHGIYSFNYGNWAWLPNDAWC